MNLQTAAYELSAGTARQLPPSSLPEIVFSGRSNVGKSTLLNKLLGRKALARVSATPGKTVTINFYRVDTARFVDFPGYGYAKRPDSERRRWADLAEGYFAGGRRVALVVQLIDMRHAPSKDDLTMLHYLTDAALPFVVVYTKADKLNKTEFARRLAELEQELAFVPPQTARVPFSALSGLGVETLRQHILQAAEPADPLPEGE